MPSVIANATSAFIRYAGAWMMGNISERETSAIGSFASLNFSGSSFYLYGQLYNRTQPGGFYNLSVIIDEEEFSLLGNSTTNQPRPLFSTFLEPDKAHSAEITLHSGTFSLGYVNWTTTLEYEPGYDINVTSANSLSYSTQPIKVWSAQYPSLPTSPWCASHTGANITFYFRGNGITVQGSGASYFELPPRATFNVYVDNMLTSENLSAWTLENSTIDLYHNDTLGNDTHSVSLVTTNDEGLCVSNAHVFNTTTLTSSGHIPTNGETMLPSPPPMPLTTGQIAGIVISALSVIAFIIFGAIMLFRRRHSHKSYLATGTISHDQLCSKCGKPITDDDRPECVEPNGPAEVDRHAECADWNEPLQ